MKEEKAVNKSVVILLLIICSLSLAAGIYANYRIIKLSNKNNNEEEVVDKKNNEDNKINEEKEVSDTLIIKDLTIRQDVLNKTALTLSGEYPYIYDKLTKISDMSDSDKIISVLNYIKDSNIYDHGFNRDYPKMSFENFGCSIEEMDENHERGSIAYNNILSVYNFVYGGKPSKKDIDDDSFVYSSDYDRYFINPWCGTCAAYMLHYNEKYTEDNDYYYIYTVVGYKDCAPYIYKDYDQKELGIDFSKDDRSEDVLLKNNLDKLNHYRISFKKDGSNAYFDKVEIIK